VTKHGKYSQLSEKETLLQIHSLSQL